MSTTTCRMMEIHLKAQIEILERKAVDAYKNGWAEGYNNGLENS